MQEFANRFLASLRFPHFNVIHLVIIDEPVHKLGLDMLEEGNLFILRGEIVRQKKAFELV
ncbi:hypothetical protein D3C72_2366850 [compost metagenome]